VLHVRSDHRSISLTLFFVLVSTFAMAGISSAECLPGQLHESSLVYSKSKNALQAKHYDEAISQLKSALSICEEHIDANRDLGRAYYGLKNYEMAVKYFQRTIELSVDAPQAGNFSLLGKTFTKMKKYKEARAEYMKADQLKPNDFGVLFNLAIVSGASGFHIESVDALEKALVLAQPERKPIVLKQLAIACKKASDQQKKNGNSARSQKYADLAAKYGSEAGGSTTYDMVRSKMKAKDYKGAVPLLESMVSKKPEDSKSWLTLARARDGLKDRKGSIKAYKKYLALVPDDANTVSAMIQVMVEDGQCSVAKNTAKDATVKFASKGRESLAPIWYSYGLALECLEDFTGARAEFAKCAGSGHPRYASYGATQVTRMEQLQAQADAQARKAAQGR
jgi:tetratricopeptide (TPR) repeat protein